MEKQFNGGGGIWRYGFEQKIVYLAVNYFNKKDRSIERKKGFM
ncbi:unnamed protein product (macronuclear) [Paramecium tetraurelia]|uniref:Uncharacterized protein n=1 Tax=Paramecium tetraurelia TaxID=5888 RepID=A0C6Y2_PARTE|nr:uncharacterized protein GSPATT00035678001 [Paramecium tetraurelia]CAK66549.1 unnamed protein product [Paramecium tetraurelia]